MPSIADRLAETRERIAAAAGRGGRPGAPVRLVAVAKTASADGLRQAWSAGQREFGHNRVQALAVHQAVLPEAHWHLIGPLQRNKAGDALALAGTIQTVGDRRIAERLDRLRAAGGELPPFPVLVQLNLSPEDGRYGCPAESLPALLEFLAGLARLEARGLMTLGPQGAGENRLRRHFAALKLLAEANAARGLLPAAPELSMGMSEDYEIAVEEGATLVRVGRAVFPPVTEREPERPADEPF
ncbi:MAG: YggS family pyridoxal phosphate-dependent enzyme [Planctomycetes bacterium]|nr:YggS family pyridoxal phosphate-dependent enzyme [Planctomycetota bacterium]